MSGNGEKGNREEEMGERKAGKGEGKIRRAGKGQGAIGKEEGRWMNGERGTAIEGRGLRGKRKN